MLLGCRVDYTEAAVSRALKEFQALEFALIPHKEKGFESYLPKADVLRRLARSSIVVIRAPVWWNLLKNDWLTQKSVGSLRELTNLAHMLRASYIVAEGGWRHSKKDTAEGREPLTKEEAFWNLHEVCSSNQSVINRGITKLAIVNSRGHANGHYWGSVKAINKLTRELRSPTYTGAFDTYAAWVRGEPIFEAARNSPKSHYWRSFIERHVSLVYLRPIPKGVSEGSFANLSSDVSLEKTAGPGPGFFIKLINLCSELKVPIILPRKQISDALSDKEWIQKNV